jgi:putative transposase
VLVTKYRHKVITGEIGKRLEEITKNLLHENFDCELLEFNFEEDHIHLLFETKPQAQISRIVNSLKTVTSRLIRKEYKEYISKYYWKPYFWSHSYFVATTGGATLEIIKKYIQSQDTPK